MTSLIFIFILFYHEYLDLFILQTGEMQWGNSPGSTLYKIASFLLNDAF